MDNAKNEMLTAQLLEEMAQVDIRTIDPNTLVDTEDVTIHPDLPMWECVADYIRQIGNPYCFKSHGITVKLSFAGKKTLEECLKDSMWGYVPYVPVETKSVDRKEQYSKTISLITPEGNGTAPDAA